jgi:hypothetical protein
MSGARAALYDQGKRNVGAGSKPAVTVSLPLVRSSPKSGRSGMTPGGQLPPPRPYAARSKRVDLLTQQAEIDGLGQ